MEPKNLCRPATILRHAVFAGLPALMLSACAAQLTNSARLDKQVDPDAWYARRHTVAVEVHGSVPGFSQAQIAAMYPHSVGPQYAALGALPAPGTEKRTVLYINATNLPDNAALCGKVSPQIAPQDGDRAHVTAVLCDGAHALSVAQANVSVTNASELKDGLDTVQDEAFQVLYPPPLYN